MEKPDEVLALFRYIEDNFDLEKLNYKGLNMWPVLRKEIGFHLSLKVPAFEYEVPAAMPRQNNFLKTLYRSLKLRFAKQRFLSSVEKFPAPSLFCTYPNSLFIDEVGGRQYSRYLDPYFEVLGKKFRMARFSVQDEKTISPLHNTSFLDLTDFKKYYYLKAFIGQEDKRNEAGRMKATFAEINDLVHSKFGIRPAYSGIIKQFDEVLFYKEFTDAFMAKNAHVEHIFMECFYDTFKLAMTASSKGSKAKVIEIQHGGAEDNVYVPYCRPHVKMDLLPEFFWCWSHSDHELLQKHNAKDFPYLRPFVGGNMWLKKFIHNEMPLPADHSRFLSDLRSKYTNIVLVSLQLSIGLVDAMLDAISTAPADVFFLVRFHPLTSEEERAAILIKLRPFERVETGMASSIHLYHLFNTVTFQITHSSTTAMEALSFKVATIICSAFGYDYYKSQVEQKILFYATDAPSILGIISGAGTLDFNNVNHFLIQTDADRALENLETALKACAA